jgi:hypothetical protein
MNELMTLWSSCLALAKHSISRKCLSAHSRAQVVQYLPGKHKGLEFKTQNCQKWEMSSVWSDLLCCGCGLFQQLKQMFVRKLWRIPLPRSPLKISIQVWSCPEGYMLPRYSVWIVWLTFTEGFRKESKMALSTLSSKTVARVEVSSFVKLVHVGVCLSTEAKVSTLLCKKRHNEALTSD